jgi:hypothetical protein
VLDKQPKLKGQKFIALVGWDSAKAINETGYKIFIGPTQGTNEVLSDPEAQPMKRSQLAHYLWSLESRREGLMQIPSLNVEGTAINVGVGSGPSLSTVGGRQEKIPP